MWTPPIIYFMADAGRMQKTLNSHIFCHGGKRAFETLQSALYNYYKGKFLIGIHPAHHL